MSADLKVSLARSLPCGRTKSRGGGNSCERVLSSGNGKVFDLDPFELPLIKSSDLYLLECKSAKDVRLGESTALTEISEVLRRWLSKFSVTVMFVSDPRREVDVHVC